MANFDELFAVDNLRRSLVRADAIEAWAPKLFPLEALPGFTALVRRALLCLCRNGQVLYLETSMVGARFFRRKSWFGHYIELGRPNPAPRGFLIVKALRVYDVRNRSLVVAIDGCPKIIFFTGITKDRGLPQGTGFTRNIPQAGIFIGWVESAVIRARNPHSARLGREATEAWRSILAGKTDPATLPLLYDVAHRHEYRYWSGTGWTPQVSDNAVTGTDPLPSPVTGSPPPGPVSRQHALADDRLAAAAAEYMKRRYRILPEFGGTVGLERPATGFNWGWTAALIVLAGPAALLYVIPWAIWGVHKTYRATLRLGPQGEVEEAGDVLAVYDRDRLQAHRRRCAGFGLFFAGVTLILTISMIANLASAGTAPASVVSIIVGVALLVLLPAAAAVLLFSKARGAARKLGLAPDWWRLGLGQTPAGTPPA